MIEHPGISPESIGYLNESSLSNVKKPKYIISVRGQKQVRKGSSWKRVNTVIEFLQSWVSAKKPQYRIINNDSAGTVGITYSSGWMHHE